MVLTDHWVDLRGRQIERNCCCCFRRPFSHGDSSYSLSPSTLITKCRRSILVLKEKKGEKKEERKKIPIIFLLLLLPLLLLLLSFLMVSGMIFHDVIGHHVCVCVRLNWSTHSISSLFLSYWSFHECHWTFSGTFALYIVRVTFFYTKLNIGHTSLAHGPDRPFKVHLLFCPGLESGGYLTWHLPINQIKCNHLLPSFLPSNTQMSILGCFFLSLAVWGTENGWRLKNHMSWAYIL